MTDVVKTNVKREQSRKRKRRRKRHTMFYFFLVVIIVIGIAVLLSVTIFFNVKTVNVNGNVDYTNKNIIMASGISDGENLIRLDSKKAAENILSSMIYIETAVIDKHYPGTVDINVTACVPTANIKLDSGYFVVSEKGKILEQVDDTSNGLPSIEGVEPVQSEIGKYIDSENVQKNKIILELLHECSKDEKHKIKSVDINDIYDISVNYDNRITFEMGNSNEISYKMSLASTVLEKIGSNKHGVMKMAGTNQISFREDKEKRENPDDNTKVPIDDNDPDNDSDDTTEPDSNYNTDNMGDLY